MGNSFKFPQADHASARIVSNRDSGKTGDGRVEPSQEDGGSENKEQEKKANIEPDKKGREELKRAIDCFCESTKEVMNLAPKSHDKSLDTNEDEDDDDIMAAVHSGSCLSETRTAFIRALDGPQVSFKLLLDHKHDKTTEEKELEVEGDLVPLSVLKLKLCIEHQFSIPACCQTITFDCVTLEDQCLLSSYYIRDGDCLRVSFETKADVSEIMETIDNMKKTYVFIRSLYDLNKANLSDDTLYQIDQTVCSDDIENLPEVYFSYNLDKAEINRIFFVHCGGVRLFHKLHTELLKIPWSILPLKMQYLELSILRCYWNITAAFSVRMSVLHNSNVLQNIVKSFMRIELVPGVQVKAPKSVYVNRIGHNRWKCDQTARSVVFKAMGALCNLAEIPECRMQIASNQALLQQLVAIMACPSFHYIASLIAMAGMLCLAYSAETHVFLSTPSIVNGVITACSKIQPSQVFTEPASQRRGPSLLKYFSAVLFAMILNSSPELLALKTRLAILELKEDFFVTADHLEIRQEEVKSGFKWSTVIPYMKLAYHPYSDPRRSLGYSNDSDTAAMRKLDRCCIQCGIFSLSNLLQCPITRDIFLEEGLLDYMVCMPWLYPGDWQERRQAQELVAYLGQTIQLQPPSLINLTKARLASMHFGLERVLRTNSVHELLSDVNVQ